MIKREATLKREARHKEILKQYKKLDKPGNQVTAICIQIASQPIEGKNVPFSTVYRVVCKHRKEANNERV